MSAKAQRIPFEPFFLPASRGQRFCLFHPPARSPRGAILYLHPFAEEMNKSRRMAAVQSRALAARGYAVLQIDLFGCGDSSGDFGDARWEIWKEDVSLGVAWLRQHCFEPIRLWGLRLGALLALDFAAWKPESVSGFLLWQPVLSGMSFLTQFLRLRVAREMIADDAARISTHDLRAELSSGTALEVAGYDIAPDLVRAIDCLDLAQLSPRGSEVRWFEVVPEAAGRKLSPASQRVADTWSQGGVRLDTRVVAGPQFWNSIEITECRDLIAETCRAVGEGLP